jgi:hypothetical protein
MADDDHSTRHLIESLLSEMPAAGAALDQLTKELDDYVSQAKAIIDIQVGKLVDPPAVRVMAEMGKVGFDAGLIIVEAFMGSSRKCCSAHTVVDLMSRLFALELYVGENG